MSKKYNNRYTGPAQDGRNGYYAHTQVDPYQDMDYGYGFDNGVDPYATVDTSGLMPTVGYGADASNQGGLFDSWSGKDMLDGALGVGQMGLGLMNYFQNKDMNKARMKGLNEQIKSSKYARNRHNEFVGNTRGAFA